MKFENHRYWVEFKTKQNRCLWPSIHTWPLGLDGRSLAGEGCASLTLLWFLSFGWQW